MLPLIPAVSILAGRAVHDVALLLAARWRRMRRRSGVGWMSRAGQPIALPVALLASGVMVAFMATPMIDAARSRLLFRPARGRQVAEDEHVAPGRA